MADPFRPGVTPRQVEEARRDQLRAVGKATGIVGGITAANYFLNAPGGPIVQKPLQIGLTGVEVKKTDAGRAAVRIPRATFLVALAPTPLGYVPAEYYGLPPDVYKQKLGRKIGSKPPFFEATEARKSVFRATELADDLGHTIMGTPKSSYIIPPGELKIPAGPIRISAADLAWLQSLPPGVSQTQVLIPLLEKRQSDFVFQAPKQPTQPLDEFFPDRPSVRLVPPVAPRVTAILDEFSDNLISLPGSTQPETFVPTNQAGVNNQAAATGIRKELVTERADP